MKNFKNIMPWGLLSLLVTGVFFAFRPKATKLPNIIVVVTDDHRWDALGAMGNNIIQTPHLDKLARKGLLFKNAYVTTAICMVSRASLLSGQYLSRHKINEFTTDFSKEAVAQTYPILLKKAGYTIGFINKYGVGQKNTPKAYFDFWTCTPKLQPDYEMQDEAGHFIHNTDQTDRDIQTFLDRFGKQAPFCLSIGFKAPHEQDGDPPRFIVQEKFKNLYQNVTIPTPETADPKYWNSFPAFFKNDKNIARVRWKPLFATPELAQETTKNYYRLITGVDEVIGNMVAKLEKLGIADNTVILFIGDNGFYLGEHGLEGKWFGHEESIRVPLILYDPRQPAALQGKTISEIALNVDVAPTILKLANQPIPGQMQGVDLLALAAQKPGTARQSFFYEHTFMGSPRLPKVEGVVSREMKYMQFIEHHYEELYDLKKDPKEKQNLAADPTYQKQLQIMRFQYQKLKQEAQ
ncbi:sulfatase family protein [Adhaeribacter pallidiroseus]|uniref:Arylsulfatase n=1 Tax=Adhaeribacter pallidiroseus TaxID=2072847 RepID=A0A369QVJ2_9BACT|nr:sulfatase [Adhaeribacter pallidiroseus]RDC66198.1 Arylsulfatase [Adhaeribacter pallidiroseus]